MRYKRWLTVSIALVIVVSLVTTTALWLAGNTVVAPANRKIGAPPENLPFETHTIASNNGANLATWYLRNEHAKATIVLLHANRASRRSMLHRAELLYSEGFSLVLIDFQGHGESHGEKITAGYLEQDDAKAAVEFARRQDPHNKIGVIGCSLGGASALLASPLDIDALIIESVYPTITEAIDNRIEKRVGSLSAVISPIFTFQLQARFGISPEALRPIESVAKVECPLLVASGDQDKLTTLEETKAIYSRAKDPKSLVIFQGASHEDLLKHSPTLYRDEVIGFLIDSLGP